MAQELKIQTPTPPMTPATAQASRMTYEEFLDWADEDTWAEWVDGEVILMSPASDPHQDLLGFLSSLLRHFVEAHGLGRVLIAPFQMKLSVRPSGREPDLIFIAKEHLDRLKKTYLDGPADLAIEIVSTDSRSRDRGEKFYEYEQAAMPEYWMLDRSRRQAEFYQLGENGTYQRMNVGDDGNFRSHVIKGLWLRVDWLWQDPLPTLMSVLKEWGLVK